MSGEFVGTSPTPWNSAGPTEAKGYPRPRQWLDLGCGNQK